MFPCITPVHFKEGGRETEREWVEGRENSYESVGVLGQ